MKQDNPNYVMSERVQDFDIYNPLQYGVNPDLYSINERIKGFDKTRKKLEDYVQTLPEEDKE